MSRLFFALWPEESVRAQLAAAAAQLPARQGRPVPAANLHMTLLFLGSVPDEFQSRLQQSASEVKSAPFMLTIDRSGYFRAARVSWLAPREMPAGLLDLADRLAVSARNCGLSVEERRFRPHLTIARKVLRPPHPLRFAPIHWEINSFTLVESISAGVAPEYRAVQRWPLTSTAD
jgi:2'-5' RNA ligase